MKCESDYIVRVSIFLEYSIESLDLIGHNLHVCRSDFIGPWAYSGPNYHRTATLKIALLTSKTSY